MPIRIRNTDIHDNTEGMIILPIDGIGPCYEGSLARQYATMFPDHWNVIKKKIQYPLALGKTAFVPQSKEKGYDYVLVAATLNHIDQLSRDDARGIVFNITRQALNLAEGFEIRRIATIVLKGGWRLSLDEALLSMFDACDISSGLRKIEFEIFESNPQKFERILSLARTLGWV